MFVLVVAAAEDFLEEVLLLGLVGLCRVGGVAVRGSVGGIVRSGRRCGWRRRGRGGGVGLTAYAEELLEEVLGALGHLAAGVDWSGAVEEGYVEGVAGASGVGKEICGLVDASGGHAFLR